jgi:hypothetical protein
MLTVVRDDLLSVLSEDLSDNRALLQKATHFYTVSTDLQNLQNLKITESRIENLAEKRQEKRNQSISSMPPTISLPLTWSGPPAPPQTVEEI